jgi:ubiquinone biosynthesis protein UbiJ
VNTKASNANSAIFSNTLHTAAIGALETVINQALKLDPATLKQLGRLRDHVFLLHCTAPEMRLYLIPGEGEVRLCGFYDGKADTRLSGSAKEFTKLATAADPASALINGELELHGDSQALISLQKILKQLDIDWEAPLANVFGDVLGHQLGRGIRQAAGFGLQALTGLKRQLNDYIVHESDLLPAQWQADKFFNQVDQLAMRTERLDAQLQKLKLKKLQLEQSKPQKSNQSIR